MSASEGFVPRPVERPLAGDPLKVTVHRLSNGLTAYLSPNPLEPRVSYEIAVRAGSRHDPLEATGMAHYLEHMQFKGTRRLGTLDYAKERPHLDRIEALYDRLFGATDPRRREELYAEIDRESQAAAGYAVPNELDRTFSAAGFNAINAHTSYDETVYKGSFPANQAGLWARLEADRLTEPVYRIFLPELETVYEEYNRSRDDAEASLYYAGLRALFKGHPYGRDIIGLGEHLKNPSLSRMHAFFRAYYRPNNMAVVLSGDFDRRKMLALLESSFGGLKPAAPPPAPAGEIRGPSGAERTELRYQAEEKVRIGWLLPGCGHPDADALTLMDMLMDNRWTGILNLSVNKAQKVKDSGSFPVMFNEAGGWFVSAASKEGQTLEEAEDVLLEAVARLKDGGFTEGDLEAVIVDFEVREKRRLERNGSRVAHVGKSFLQGEQWEEAAGRLARLERVKKADVLRAARKYLGEDRVVVYRRKGEPEADKVAKPAFTPVAIDPARRSLFSRELSSTPAKPLAPRFLRRGRDYRTLDRAWGRLYWTANPVNDLFQLEFRFARGAAHDKRLALAFRFLELCGAGDGSVEEFQRELYRLGSAMSVRCGERECAVRVTGLEAKLAETLRLVRVRFSRPKAAEGAFDKMVQVERGDRANRKLDPKWIAGALKESASRGQDSAVFKELSPRELDALTEDELEGVLRSVFAYRRDVLYTGGRKAEEIAKLLSSAESGRRLRPAPKGRAVKLIARTRPRVVFVHRGDLSQAVITAYAADGPYDKSARLDAVVYGALMGGMSGAYFQEVREARALAYDAGGGYALGEWTGDDNSVWSQAGTQADKAVETARLLRDLMRRPPLTPERFAAACREVSERYRTVVLQLEAIPATVHAWEKRGFKTDPREASFRRLRAYGRKELERFTARFVGKPLTFCVLADRARIKLKDLEELGELEERSVDELFPF